MRRQLGPYYRDPHSLSKMSRSTLRKTPTLELQQTFLPPKHLQEQPFDGCILKFCQLLQVWVSWSGYIDETQSLNIHHFLPSSPISLVSDCVLLLPFHHIMKSTIASVLPLMVLSSLSSASSVDDLKWKHNLKIKSSDFDLMPDDSSGGCTGDSNTITFDIGTMPLVGSKTALQDSNGLYTVSQTYDPHSGKEAADPSASSRRRSGSRTTPCTSLPLGRARMAPHGLNLLMTRQAKT